MDAETALVVRRCRYSKGIQLFRYPAVAHAVQFPLEYALYILPGYRVSYQLIMVAFVLHEPIGDIGPGVFPVPPLALQVAPDLHGKVGAVSVIDKILYRYDNVLLRPICGQGIVMVGNRDETHPRRREYLLQIPPGFYVFPAKTGKILHNDEVDLSRFHILYHLLKGRPQEVGTGIPVIHILLIDMDILPVFQKIMDKPLLVGDAVALPLAALAAYIPVFFG